jgi:hypothetical protein
MMPGDFPDLGRALPADTAEDSQHVNYRAQWARVLFRDGSRRDVQVRARQRDKRGRWVYLLDWHARGDSRGDWFVYEAERMQPLDEA